MNVVVVPDAAMIVIPLIEKNGHRYLSPSNFSRYDNMDICEGNLEVGVAINKYVSSELPSGVKSRLFLFSKVLYDADAAIIIGKRPKDYNRMYGPLNDLILFGGNACNNAHSLFVKMINDLHIPTLRLAFPTSQNQIIKLINQTNNFLRSLNNSVNDDGLSTDLTINKQQYPVSDFKNILDNLI